MAFAVEILPVLQNGPAVDKTLDQLKTQLAHPYTSVHNLAT